MKTICKHPTAHRDYIFEEKYEAGLVLRGSEVKSLRGGNASVKESFALIRGGEARLVNCYIAPYDAANTLNHEPTRERKLLLNSHEIRRLIGKTSIKGYTLVPLRIYFKNGIAKLELALAKGKKTRDKREDIKRREAQRDMQKAVRRSLKRS